MAWEGLNPPYGTIVADPPWPQKGAGPLTGREGFVDAHGSTRPMPYSTMSIEEILHLPVRHLVDQRASLYLWTTNGFLPVAFQIMQYWGFQYSATLVWAKNPMGGGLGGAYGIATEFILYGWRGRANAKDRMSSTWFNWKRPYDERGKPQHSAKPTEFFKMVGKVSPGPYLELFAREQRVGWDGWGLEYEAAS